jgi:hypothetical protein
VPVDPLPALVPTALSLFCDIDISFVYELPPTSVIPGRCRRVRAKHRLMTGFASNYGAQLRIRGLVPMHHRGMTKTIHFILLNRTLLPSGWRVAI